MVKIKGSNRELTKKEKINIFFKSIFSYFDLKRYKSNSFYQKKATGPVVATALLLVVAVVAVIGFEGWFNSYQSSINAKVEQDSSKGSMNTLIDTVVGSNLYFKNGYSNLTIKDIKIDGTSCQISPSTYSQGLKEIEIGNCTNNATSSTPDIVVITDKGVFSKKIYLKGVTFSTPLYSSCSLNSVNLNHQESYIFYNSTTVPFQDTCSFITRTCNDGVLSGDSSYQYSSCSIEGQDITPDPFNFVNQTDVALNSIIISNVVVPTGFEGPLTVSITGDGSPQLSINGGSWVISGQINLNDNLTLRLTSSSNSLTSNIANLTLGNYSTLWNVTTKYLLNCSTLSLNGGNWITVPGSSTYGNSDFCVMKYEAKATTASEANLFDSVNMYCGNGTIGGGNNCLTDGSVNITSKAASKPLTRIYQTEARQLCANLGANYHLITDAEWVTIARNAENVSSNWADNTIGSQVSSGGGLKRGNIGIDDSVSYNAAIDPADRSLDTNSKAMFTLSNGETIWDISGNVWEWTNDTFNTNTESALGQVANNWYDWTSISGYDYLKPYHSNFNLQNGVGRVYVDVDDAYPSGTVHGFRRGGNCDNGIDAGAFAMYFPTSPLNSYPKLGFRCSYTP